MPPEEEGFYHEALLYAGPADFVAAAAPAIRAAVAREEPVLVMVDLAKIEHLRADLGSQADAVRFDDVQSVGVNPARLVPAWHAFIDGHAHTGRTAHGIVEPVWPERGPPELVECRHYEALVNAAFAAAPPFRLSCAYDIAALAASEIAGAEGTHPFVRRGGETRAMGARARLEPAELFAETLSGAPAQVEELTFDDRSLVAVRRFVRARAAPDLDPAALHDLVLAVDELAVNAVRHGGGAGTLRIWHDGTHVVCEVSDEGHITDPLVGCHRPGPLATEGRGLWMVNQLCELVQIRSGPAGTTVRVYKRGT